MWFNLASNELNFIPNLFIRRSEGEKRATLQRCQNNSYPYFCSNYTDKQVFNIQVTALWETTSNYFSVGEKCLGMVVF